MAARHDRLTTASLGAIAAIVTVMLHEALGHGVVSWLRGDVPTMLTSNHLSDLHPDKLVAAGGSIVNVIVGSLAWLGFRRAQNNTLRYALWLFALDNMMEATGYLFFSGVSGLGDWQVVIADLPAYGVVRAAMALIGAGLYVLVILRFSRALRDYARAPFALWLLPYLAGVVVQCAAGALDPLGATTFFTSTVAGTVGGTSGLAYGSFYEGKATEPRERVVGRVPWLWVVAAIVVVAHVAIDGPGIRLFAGDAS